MINSRSCVRWWLAEGAAACTSLFHALALAATGHVLRHEKRLGRAGAGSLIDLAIVALAILFAFVAHLIEIALWAVLLIICGKFRKVGNAFCHSAVLLTSSRRLFGPLKAANGALMFGVSTEMVFALIQRLFRARLEDPRSERQMRAIRIPIARGAAPLDCDPGIKACRHCAARSSRGALVLDQEHQEFRRLSAPYVPIDDMNIIRPS
jgi:hypothetical protein